MKTLFKLFLFAGAGLWTGLVAGQTPDYTLRASDVMAVPGIIAAVPIDLDIAPSADPVLSFSFSLCSDSTVAIPQSVEVGEDLMSITAKPQTELSWNSRGWVYNVGLLRVSESMARKNTKKTS